MSTNWFMVLRVVFDVCGIIGCAIALRCGLKHHGRIHV